MMFVLLAMPLTASADDKEILFINPGFKDKGFWKAVSDTMREASVQFGFSLEIVSADRKWPLMVSRGLEAIQTKDPDFLVIVNEHQQAPVLLDAASKKNIPTILLLNDLTDEQKHEHGNPRQVHSNWIGTITPDNEIAGYEIAMSLLTPKSSKGNPTRILSLAGDFKTPASISRLKGLDRAISELGGTLSESRRLTVNWSEAEAYERTLRFLASSRVGGIWAANDPIAFGAIKALQETGLEPGVDVRVSGLNWSPNAIDRVIKGEMEITHGGHFMAGAWAVVLIADYAAGVDFADVDTHIRFPMSAMNSEKASIYKEALGDSDWSKIDFAAFSRQNRPHSASFDFSLQNLLSNIR